MRKIIDACLGIFGAAHLAIGLLIYDYQIACYGLILLFWSNYRMDAAHGGKEG